MQPIEAILRKGIGLDAASIGSSLIERTVRLRMKLHGLKATADYEQMLLSSPAEFNELIEAIVVTETWFFRDREPFNAFTAIAVGEWLPKHSDSDEPMRILSVPCSSGEEPYSLAMCLLDAGVPQERFQIDAVDISQNALTRAARGIYGKNSFRGQDLGFRTRHFTERPEGFALSPIVRQQVNFQRDNVLDDGFMADSAPYRFYLLSQSADLLRSRHANSCSGKTEPVAGGRRHVVRRPGRIAAGRGERFCQRKPAPRFCLSQSRRNGCSTTAAVEQKETHSGHHRTALHRPAAPRA
ncbi:MAG: CheR family methyltransferase [Verrucomicrobiota bacterium]